MYGHSPFWEFSLLSAKEFCKLCGYSCAGSFLACLRHVVLVRRVRRLPSLALTRPMARQRQELTRRLALQLPRSVLQSASLHLHTDVVFEHSRKVQNDVF